MEIGLLRPSNHGKKEKSFPCPDMFFLSFRTWELLLFLIKIFLNMYSFPFYAFCVHAFLRIINPPGRKGEIISMILKTISIVNKNIAFDLFWVYV